MKFLNIGSTAVSHTCTQTTTQLINNFEKRTFIRNTGSDSFRNKLLHISSSTLEVAVFRTILHCFQRTHTTIGFEFTTIEDNSVTRRFLCSGN